MTVRYEGDRPVGVEKVLISAQLHRQFVHAGSDVVEAFTYYAHREKLRIVGKEELLEATNRQALARVRSTIDAHEAMHAKTRSRL